MVPCPSDTHLVEVTEAHPLDGGGLPLGQRGHKLHGGRLLLHHAQRQGAQHGVALVDEGLRGGAGVHRDHLTAWVVWGRGGGGGGGGGTRGSDQCRCCGEIGERRFIHK